jgi:hypothetical protein
LGQREGAIADVDCEEQFALGVHRHPDPLGRTLQPRGRLGLTDCAVLDRAEQRKQLIELYLLEPHVTQEVLRKGTQLLGRLHEPL